MTSSMSERCRACVRKLKEVISALANPRSTDEHVKQAQVNEELDRFILFVGNIGGFHEPESPLSVDSRLREAEDVLDHILGLLDDLVEAAEELRQIVCGERQGMTCGPDENEDGKDLGTSEEDELRDEISATITRLFRVTTLVRQAAPTDPFAKALSRNRYRFNDQFDIAHVGQRYPNLATDNYIWLRQRLGKAITHRRHYLSYMRDHRDKLEGSFDQDDKTHGATSKTNVPIIDQQQGLNSKQDAMSRPSFFTKATTIVPDRLALSSLDAEEPDSDEDTRSYTTISRSVDGNDEPSTTFRIPRLEDLRSGSGKEIECPFCFRIKRFKNERIWRKHVFSDIRPYVCTFPGCDAPYFGDINKWFQHEMTYHRVAYRCFLCPDAFYHREKAYVAHLKRRHPDTVDHAESEQNITLAREPLSQIPAADCPCCTDWVDRLREHAGLTGDLTPNEILTVDLTAFKRHLAKHLEHLALFAIPTSATADDPQNSTDANDILENHTAASQLSALTFSSEQRRDNLVSDGGGASRSERTVVLSPTNDAEEPQAQPRLQPRLEHISQEPLMPELDSGSIDICAPSVTKLDREDANQGWTWSDEHQDHYYVTYDQYQRPVYHWGQQYSADARQAESHSPDTRPREDAAAEPQMPEPASEEARTLQGFISGTPQTGWYDNLDAFYRVRTGQEAREFFKVGKIFAMLYTETASDASAQHPNDDAYTVVRFGESTHTNIRRFVVVDVRRGFVIACGIGTYAGRGTLKDGYNPAKHTIVYFSGTNLASCYIPGEYESGMTKGPIEVVPVDPNVSIRRESRIRFSKAYPIEMNVKVKDVGQVREDQISALVSYWAQENHTQTLAYTPSSSTAFSSNNWPSGRVPN